MPRLDYFNEGESAAQKSFANRRDKIFAPIVKALIALGVKPLHVSIFGVALCTLVIFISPDYWMAIAILLVLYILADGIDGPLARATNGGSNGGALVDIFSDQVGVFIVALAAVTWLEVTPQAHFVFAFFYILCVFSMVIVNAIGQNVINTVRLKYFYFLLYVVSCSTRYDFLIDWFAIVFSIYYIIMFLLQFRVIIIGVDEE